MKKFLFCAALFSAVTFASCGGDDNGGGDDCTTCNFDGESVEYCDLGGGTYSADGQEFELQGVSFSQFIIALELTQDCN